MKQYTGLRLNDNHPIQDGTVLDESAFGHYMKATDHLSGPQPADLEVGQTLVRRFAPNSGVEARIEFKRLPDKV